MKVTWRAAPGNVINYRVTYKPQAGGRQLAAKVPGGTTTTILRRLTPITTYDITVLPVYRSGEGKARQGEGTTRTYLSLPINVAQSVAKFRKTVIITSTEDSFEVNLSIYSIPGLSYLVTMYCACLLSPVSPYKAPRNLQTSEPTKTSFRVTWDHAPGDVRGYKVTFHPVGEDINLGELLVGPYDNTVVLEELRCVFITIYAHIHTQKSVGATCL